MTHPLPGLKEWDAQCQLLLAGETALLIRKGGIMETHDGFEVEHRRFLLYPTYLHQNRAELQERFQSLLRDDPDPGTVHFPALAEVVAVEKVESLEKAVALAPLQALTEAAIERRFGYRGRPWVHALLLRVRPLRPALSLPETPEMLGCVSWVPLAAGDVQAGEPVLGESRLSDLEAELRARLA